MRLIAILLSCIFIVLIGYNYKQTPTEQQEHSFKTLKAAKEGDLVSCFVTNQESNTEEINRVILVTGNNGTLLNGYDIQKHSVRLLDGGLHYNAFLECKRVGILDGSMKYQRIGNIIVDGLAKQ